MSIRNRFAFSSTLLLLVLAVSTPTFAQNGEGRLTLDRYLSWEDVSSPQLSPDGAQIVYQRRFIDPMADSWDSALWIMNADGSKNRFLVEGSSPSWSPAGTRLAEGSPSGIMWAPDGESIAFQMLVPESLGPEWRIDMPDRPEGADWTASPRIIERLNYRSDGSGWRSLGYRHVFVVPATGGAPRQVTSGDWNHGSFRWMPDGRSMVFSSLRVEDAEHVWRESEIYSVDVETGAVQQLTTRRGPDGSPVPSPDGSLIAYTGNDWSTDTYVESGLYVMNADGSNSRLLASEMGRSPGGLTWAHDGSGIYYSASMRGTSHLWFAPLDGEPRQVTEGNYMLSVGDIGRNGTVVATMTSPQVPRNLVSLDLRRPSNIETLHVTNQTHLEEVELGEVEEIWYESVDGWQIHGWIVKHPTSTLLRSTR